MPHSEFSFCAKQEADVKKLIVGPGVCICDECVGLAQAIINLPAREQETGRSADE